LNPGTRDCFIAKGERRETGEREEDQKREEGRGEWARGEGEGREGEEGVAWLTKPIF
jgi:hypothetical protein